MRAFNVYLNGKKIDTVFYSAGANVDRDEVRRALIDHDGYNPGISVREDHKLTATPTEGSAAQ